MPTLTAKLPATNLAGLYHSAVTVPVLPLVRPWLTTTVAPKLATHECTNSLEPTGISLALTLSEGDKDQFGYSVSLSSDGSSIAIGGTGNDGNGTRSGHTRVFNGFFAIGTFPQE